MRTSHAIIFYVGIPFLLGLVFGLQRSGVGMFLDVPTSVAFWTVSAFFAWITNDAGTRVTSFALRQAGAPLWATLLIGVLIGHTLNLTTWEWRTALIVGDAQVRHLALPQPSLELPYIIVVAKSLFIGGVLWLGANYLMLAGFGAPRYGYDPQVPTTAQPEGERFANSVADASVQGVQIVDPDDVIAVEAQQHYVILHRRHHQQMLHMRFGDAERILGEKRCYRVHRSFWVARSAIETVEHDGAVTRLRLCNGMSVPVGRTYLLNLRNSGLT